MASMALTSSSFLGGSAQELHFTKSNCIHRYLDHSSSAQMASMALTSSSFLGGSAAGASVKHLPPTSCCRIVAVSASRDSDKAAPTANEESYNTRRGCMVAVVAVAASTLAKVALAEPKRGNEEAKKKYAPVCVTMPTARICHN